METPARAINSAIPSTSSSVKAVNTSRRPVRAIMRSTGRVKKRPITTTATTAPSTRNAAASSPPLAVSAGARASIGTSATSGMAAMS
jgi:hypothetical protein